MRVLAFAPIASSPSVDRTVKPKPNLGTVVRDIQIVALNDEDGMTVIANVAALFAAPHLYVK